MKDLSLAFLMAAGIFIAAVGIGLRGPLSFELITMLTTAAGVSIFAGAVLEDLSTN